MRSTFEVVYKVNKITIIINETIIIYIEVIIKITINNTRDANDASKKVAFEAKKIATKSEDVNVT